MPYCKTCLTAFYCGIIFCFSAALIMGFPPDLIIAASGIIVAGTMTIYMLEGNQPEGTGIRGWVSGLFGMAESEFERDQRAAWDFVQMNGGDRFGYDYRFGYPEGTDMWGRTPTGRWQRPKERKSRMFCKHAR
jgi:hypothetical protein